MVIHHSQDYKQSAVQYYLKTHNQLETCRVFGCSRSSLQNWIKEYEMYGRIRPRKQTQKKAYKVSNQHVAFLKEQVEKKPDIFMSDLQHIFHQKYPDVSLSRVHIGRILRDNRKTRKRLRKIHQPNLYRGKSRNHRREVQTFLERVRRYPMEKIICLDETALYSALHPSYARCDEGRKCYIKTTDNKVFKHYSLLVAITNKETIGHTLYERGSVNAERLTEFIEQHINPKYSGHLIIMDNAIFHKSQMVKDAVQRGGNEILYSVAYYPRSNPIEQYFSQVKHYIKKKSPIEFGDIKNVLQESIRKVKPENYHRYYLHAFRGEWLRRTRRRRHSVKKKYKDD